MQTWTPPRPSLAKWFWALAGQPKPPAGRSTLIVIVRHVLDILAALDAAREGGAVAPTTAGFLAELSARARLGDYAYVAPEQDPRGPTGDRALVYSVGVLMLEGLTGRHPFTAAPRSVRPGEALARLIATAPEVPPALRGVLSSATSLDPKKRFASVAALATELEWLALNEEQCTPRPPRAVSVPRRAASPPPARVLPASLPPVVVDQRVLAQAWEMQVETALVPKLDQAEPLPEELKARPRAARLLRRFGPKRRGERARMAALGLLLMVGSAALTALLLVVLQG
jgi:hypothetical protein